MRVTQTVWKMVWAVLLLAAPAGTLHAQQPEVALTTGWQARAVSAPEHPEVMHWFAATVPGVVQTDLHHAGLIPDPFYGDNEKRLQWIERTDWEYRETFQVSPAQMREAHRDLIFEGLDTFADVSLNGTPLLSTDNMFRTWRVDTGSRLHAGENTLHILFHSPTNRMTPYVAALPYVLPGTGYEPLNPAAGIFPVGHYMRKAPYGYGWDWGPRFVTSGIWRPIRLESWSAVRVEALHLHQDSVTAGRALVTAEVELQADAGGPATVTLHAQDSGGHDLPPQTLQVTLDRGPNTVRLPMRIEHPALWFPNGYGAQSRYTFRAEVARGGRVLAARQTRTGFRSVELRRTPDRWGTSFTFVVNGIPIFAKGANFIPLDSFAPSVTDARRRAILTAARDVHMNMLRVWGGGFYETDSFYDLCDELGLMVWHDFMFGGALVPGDKPFQDNVQEEAQQQVARLSDHPSLALWCGNNEVEDAWRHWADHLAFEKTLTPEQREKIWQDYVVMFRDILKSTVARYGNGVPYWPSSPSSNFEVVPAGQQNGDMHSWHVWSGAAPYTDYAKEHPRFLSEFGFQSMPDLRTVRSFAGDEQDFNAPALSNHERFIGGYARMQAYLGAEYKAPRDFPSFIYLSQLLQAEAIRFAVETMRARRPETMGTLFWQLDDCWPVASWSSIDYFGRWKALQYYAARFYAPLLISSVTEGNTLNVHIVSDELAPRQLTLHLRLVGFDGAVLLDRREPAQVAALASSPAGPFELPAFDRTRAFAVLTLEGNGQVLTQNTVYFATPRDLHLPLPHIGTTLRPDGTGYTLELRSPVLARAVQVSFGDLDAKPDDNFFDLLPNEPRTVHLRSGATLAALQSALTTHSLAEATQ